MLRSLLLAVAVSLAVSSAAVSAESVAIVSSGRIAPPVRHALATLKSALKERGLAAEDKRVIPESGPTAFVIGTAIDQPVSQTLARHKLSLPEKAESLLIATVPDHAPPLIVVAGRDDRGLAYALYEVARGIETSPHKVALTRVIEAQREAPFLRTRSLQMQIFNEAVERDWYFDEDYWRGYFGMLAACRYNSFTLTFGHQTNYMNPAYAWLVPVPEYPDVRVRGLTNEARRRNLRMLNRISRLAWEYGIDFTLGIWTQQPVEKYGRTYIDNFPKGLRSADYCARALALVLTACPRIKGVQFRMNVEAGIPEAQQNEYFRQQFRGVLMCPRPVKMDLRFKGLRPQTIADAVATGRDVTVSTKFWCEHMGLPFHPTIEDDRYRESRYGYGAMLRKPRDFRVVYRMWTVGSQRLLLWGDPEYAARFARACTLGGGEGFEVFAPLSNKGFGNGPGNWSILADDQLKHYRYEYERYWHFYHVFGRAGYNPETSRSVWRREFRARLGADARLIEPAVRTASRIIPLLTATKLFGASEWRFWPEMSTGGKLTAYRHIQPSDYGQFYAIERWKPDVPGWLAEPWESKRSSFVEDALADRVQGKWTPIQVATRLNELAELTEFLLAQPRKTSDKTATSELQLTENDLRIVAQLARYHAEKTLAATQVSFFHHTRETGRLKKALKHIQKSAAAWQAIVKLTDGVYHENMVFGYSEKRSPSIEGVIRSHTGHWKDRLPEIRRDVAFVEKLLKEAPAAKSDDLKLLPGESMPGEPVGITHKRAEKAVPGKPLTIKAEVFSNVPIREVILHHRRMDQTVDWKPLRMQRGEGDNFSATIPGNELTADFDHLYYIEARVAGGGTLWPDWQRETPYVVVKTENAGAAK